MYDRYQAFSSILENRPGKLQNYNGFASHEVKFRNELRNCEDVLVEEGMGIAFLSCNPERDQWNTVMVSTTANGQIVFCYPTRWIFIDTDAKIGHIGTARGRQRKPTHLDLRLLNPLNPRLPSPQTSCPDQLRKRVRLPALGYRIRRRNINPLRHQPLPQLRQHHRSLPNLSSRRSSDACADGEAQTPPHAQFHALAR